MTYSLGCRWLLDGMLEYTSVANLPSVFAESAEDLPVKSAEILPRRMENNQLHRWVIPSF